MTAGNYDITLDAYAEYTLNLTYCNPIPDNPGVPGAPIDVTGYTAKLMVRATLGDGPQLTLTNESGITVGTTDGLFVITMTAQQTAELPGTAVYDLFITPPSAGPIKLVYGSLTAYQAVTT